MNATLHKNRCILRAHIEHIMAGKGSISLQSLAQLAQLKPEEVKPQEAEAMMARLNVPGWPAYSALRQELRVLMREGAERLRHLKQEYRQGQRRNAGRCDALTDELLKSERRRINALHGLLVCAKAWARKRRTHPVGAEEVLACLVRAVRAERRLTAGNRQRSAAELKEAATRVDSLLELAKVQEGV